MRAEEGGSGGEGASGGGEGAGGGAGVNYGGVSNGMDWRPRRWYTTGWTARERFWVDSKYIAITLFDDYLE